jgi:hypothetical protein
MGVWSAKEMGWRLDWELGMGCWGTIAQNTEMQVSNAVQVPFVSRFVILNVMQFNLESNWIQCCVYALCPSLRRFTACLVS